jgi:hypothetical protein
MLYEYYVFLEELNDIFEKVFVQILIKILEKALK